MPRFLHIWDVRRAFPVARVLKVLRPGRYPAWLPEAGLAPCPVCTTTGKNRWLRYTRDAWQCSQCKRSGDQLDLADWLLRDWSRHPAVGLCLAAGIRVPDCGNLPPPPPQQIPLPDNIGLTPQEIARIRRKWRAKKRGLTKPGMSYECAADAGGLG